MELKVEYLPITELKPYKGNAKIHTDEQIEQICQSIRQFGFNDPIAIWQDGIIIEGHGRLEAAKRLQMETVPVIRLDSLTDEERRAYTLAHNKLTMNTGFSFEILMEELDKIQGLDMSDFGFDFEDEPSPYMPPVKKQETGDEQGDDPHLPERVDDSFIQQYTDRQEQYVLKKRIIITYQAEQEERLAELLGIPEGITKVVYDIDELESLEAFN